MCRLALMRLPAVSQELHLQAQMAEDLACLAAELDIRYVNEYVV